MDRSPAAPPSRSSSRARRSSALLVDVEAQRLGSKLRPIVHLASPKKLQLAWSWGSPTLFGDCRIEAVLPEDGLYTVTLHDAEYAAPAASFFRLKIGEWSSVDQVFPPVVSRGKAQTVELLGPSGTQRLEVPAAKNLGILQLPWPKEPKERAVVRPAAVCRRQSSYGIRQGHGRRQIAGTARGPDRRQRPSADGV